VKLFKRSAKEVQPQGSPNTSRRPDFLALAPGLLAGLIGLLLAAGLLWFLMQQGNARLQAQLLQTWGNAQSTALQQGLQALKADTLRIASDPAVASALESREPQALRELEQRLSYRHGTVDVHLNARGMAAQNGSRAAPVNFAALDLLRRTELGDSPPPEAYRIGQRWLVYQAVPVRRTADGPILGSVLQAVELQKLLDLLQPVSAETGAFRLTQQFPNAPTQELAVLGQLSGNPEQSLASGNPNWSLTFSPGHLLLQPVISPIYLLLALTLSLGGVVFALSVLQGSIQRRLREDVLQLAQMLQELTAGKAALAPTLKLPALDLLARNILRLPLRKGPGVNQGNAPAEPPAASDSRPARLDPAELVNPLFQDTDILDIDILDEDQDLLGLSGQGSSRSAPSQPPRMPASIFRAYDIRGVVGETLTPEIAYWIGRAIGSQSLAKGEENVCVGRDGRLSGPQLAEQLIQGLLDCGCHVIDIGMVPTPVLYFATHTLEATSGVMLTGSHNPPDYNGFKIVIAGDTLANEQIQALRQRIDSQDLASGVGNAEQVDVLERYFTHIRDDIAMAKPIRVVVDCGNGVSGLIAPRLLEALGCSVIPLYCEVDGRFPNHHPDPGKPENLADLIARVKAEQADIGLAFDGDGDRIGVVTNAGSIVFPDRLLMLFAKDVVSRNPGADIIFDVKCTRRLTALISGYGGRPVMWKTGHSLMKKKMKETGALLAGEMSGHIFFKERWFGFDDGLYSAARLLEILSQERRDCEQLFAAFPNDISTPEINIAVSEERKFSIISTLQRDGTWGEANLTTLDGIRVDYPKGWGLIRASNTTPVLVLRFEAETQEELARIQDVFRAQLYTVAPDINLPF
jgi:phosphomannomutase/phosphoglucomutase